MQPLVTSGLGSSGVDLRHDVVLLTGQVRLPADGELLGDQLTAGAAVPVERSDQAGQVCLLSGSDWP